jgi:hypothetical protein
MKIVIKMKSLTKMSVSEKMSLHHYIVVFQWFVENYYQLPHVFDVLLVEFFFTEM